MLDSIRLRCPDCHHVFYQSVPYIQGQIKAMKIGKVGEVAQQLKEKRGPLYDRWLAAMEARGKQMRCRDCGSFWYHDPQLGSNFCDVKKVRVNPGRFACPLFRDFG